MIQRILFASVVGAAIGGSLVAAGAQSGSQINSMMNNNTMLNNNAPAQLNTMTNTHAPAGTGQRFDGSYVVPGAKHQFGGTQQQTGHYLRLDHTLTNKPSPPPKSDKGGDKDYRVKIKFPWLD
jgi:hypothetical protein